MINVIINKTKSYVGYLEKKSNYNLSDFTANAGYNNYTIFAKTYKTITGLNFQGQPWCAMFISCMFYESFGYTKGKELLIDYFHSCITGSNNFKNKGQFYKTNPKIGDIIFFYDKSKVISHVGLVYKVDSKYVYTIEGNTSAEVGVVANGGCVAMKYYTLGDRDIAGYGRPKYINLEEEKLMNELKAQVEALTQLVNSLKDQNERLTDLISGNGECIRALDAKTQNLQSQLDDTKITIYNWTEACPEWSRPYIQKALDLGILKGDTLGQLGLSLSDIRMLVMMLRAQGIMN